MHRLFALILFVTTSIAVAADPSPSLAPELHAAAAEARFGAEVPVIVTFADHLDPHQFRMFTAAHERRYRMILALKGQSEDGMRTAVTAYLRAQGAKGIKPLWLSNSLAATVPANLLAELARWPIVARIRLDAVVQAPTTAYDATTPAEWNIRAVRAPEVWGAGYTGQGVTVAILDTGVDGVHPDLAAQYRGGANSWYDPYGEHVTPYDAVGHGTSVAGVVLGRNATGNAIGVAPNAQWIAAKIFDDRGLATLSAIHQAFQWLLDPDANPATNDAPDVVNASWGLTGATACVNEFERDIQALKAADVAIVFSAGNDGPGTSTTVAPGNNAGVLSAGAVDSVSQVAQFSSRGPSACDGALDPEIAAPGVAVYTADSSFGIGNGAYAYVSGTSFAAPHVAGTMALLLSARPGLSAGALETLVRDSARDLGPAGPDNDTGYGMLDAFTALNLALASQPPVANPDSATTPEDTPVTISVLANDTNPSPAVLTLSAVTSPSASGGTVVRNADGTVTYTPAANYSGTDTFTYTVSNGSLTSTGTVTVTVTPVNDAPAAANDTLIASADATGIYAVANPGVLANDTDIEGDMLTAQLITNVASGSVTLQPGGGFSYTPPAGGVPAGPLSFTYQASDGLATSNIATVSFTFNRAPVAANDGYAFTALDANGRYSLLSPGVLANDSDPDNDPIGVSLVANVPQGQGSVDLLPTGGFSYTPPAGGAPRTTLSFTYQVSDGKSLSNIATVTFTVNQPPLASDDQLLLSAATIDGPYTLAAPGVLANDADPDGDVLTPTLLTVVEAGSVTLSANGGITYTPPLDGAPPTTLTFTYQVSDGHTTSNVATAIFSLSVPADPAPVANTGVSPSTGWSGGGSAPTQPSASSVPDVANSSFASWSTALTPAPSVGTNAATEEKSASAAAGETGTRAGKTEAVREPARSRDEDENRPAANDDDFTLEEPNEKGQYTIAAPGVLANDRGLGKLVAVLAQNTRHGKVALRQDGSFTYTPPAGGMPEGEFTFDYRAREGAIVSRVATVTLGVRQPLAAKPDTFVLGARDARGAYRVEAPGVLANDTGPGALRAVLVQDVAAGMVRLAPDGGFVYTPPASGMPKGPLSFTYKVASGKLGSRTATVMLTAPQALAANPDAFTLAAVDAQGRYVLPSPGVLANDTGGGALTAVLTRNTAAGIVTLASTGGFSYAPPATGTPAGPLTFAYRVSDGKNSSPEAVATFTLQAVSKASAPNAPRAAAKAAGSINDRNAFSMPGMESFAAHARR